MRTYTNLEQTDWYGMPPMAEYAYNNSVTTPTNQSTFYSNYGFHPKTTWPTGHEARQPASRHYAHWMIGIQTWCRKALEESKI